MGWYYDDRKSYFLFYNLKFQNKSYYSNGQWQEQITLTFQKLLSFKHEFIIIIFNELNKERFG
jgi:hypothetical protein